MFKYRLISASILIPCITIILFMLPFIEFEIIIFLICMLSAWEWGKLSNLPTSVQKKWLSSIFILLFMFLQSSTSPIFFNFKNNQYIIFITLIWWSIALLLIIFYPYPNTLWNKSTLLFLISGVLIILPFFWGTLILRNYCYNENSHNGSWLLLYIITTVWEMDSLSYIIGRTWGKHKVIPKISPHKTWEGYLGGGIITIITFWIFSKYVPIHMESLKLFSYSIAAILFSILGDLTESMFKRKSGVKDSGQLIPGHGGILDAADGLYSTIAIFACLILLTT